MGDLRKLVEAMRKRVDSLKETASNCDNASDRFALGVRADEAERCATAIDVVLEEETGDRK